MGTVHVRKYSASKVFVDVSDEIMIREIYEFFRYKDEKQAVNPFSKWDGQVRLFNKNKQLLPKGLVKHLFKWCKAVGYQFQMDEGVVTPKAEITTEEVMEYIEGLKLSIKKEGETVDITPYDYQIRGVLEGIRNESCVLLADTNAGKTLILYILARFILDFFGVERKILILCPSVLLVNQMYDDFAQFSAKDENFQMSWVHTIKAGANKYRPAPITISTWQSIQDEDPEFYHKFTDVMCDEVHGAAAAKITRILDNSVNAYKRIGVTGSMKECEMHTLQVQAHFSEIIRVATTQMLKERGQSADTLIRMVKLDYPKDQIKQASSLDYMGLIEYLVEHRGRNQFLANFVKNLDGNTLVLFDRKKHSQHVYDVLTAMGVANVYRIDGDVPEAEREAIKVKAETGNGVIILGSFGTISTGVSVRRLHNLVLAHPVESIIRVLQSIGRMLRTHSTKDVAKIYDIVDNLGQPKFQDFVFLRHARSRYRYYKDKGHKTVQNSVSFEGREPPSPDVLLQIQLDSQKRQSMAEARKALNNK